MPCWYYNKKELKNTPSAQDNIDYETEMRYRKEGARFIIDAGSNMKIGYNTTATGVVYFHRFYMFHSFRQFPRYVTACCCLFLAGKVEETPKKCKDIIRTARHLLNDSKFATFGEDPKEEVMTLERILLQTIKFDLQVEHPYNYLLRYAKCLMGDEAKLQKIVQMAWIFVNDSLCTTLALQWEPEIIAVALLYLASKLNQFEVLDWIGRNNRHLRWWDMFVEDITLDLLEDICHQVLDLYSQPSAGSTPDSPPLQPRSGGLLPVLLPGILPGSSTNAKPANGQDKEKIIEVPESILSAVAQSATAPLPPLGSGGVPDMAPYPFPPTFTSAQHPPGFPPPFLAPPVTSVPPPPHIAPPPGPPPPHMPPGAPTVPFPPFMAPPPHYPPVAPPPASYYQPTPPPPVQPHRPYYPPS